MRLLHTSDWHLGRSFHRENLLDAQAAFIDHLIATIRAERVDVVCVSGDLYDRALPPVDAVRLFGDALARIQGTGARAVLISGNHDSLVRMDYATGLIDVSGIHLRSSVEQTAVATPVVIDHERSGPVAFYGIPYLEPELVRQPWGLAERGHTAAISRAMDLVRADLATRTDTRSVVLSHAFVTGGEPSDSERDISVGGSANVAASLYDGVDYVALGHLHGRKRITETVRYSGSPLAYSFSEHHHVKGSWLIDLDSSGVASADFVEAPVPRPLSRLSGRLDDLLSDPALARHEDHWVQVTLTDAVRPRGPMEQLRERFPHTLVLEFAPEGDLPARELDWVRRTSGRPAPELVLDFVEWARTAPANDAERALIDRAFEEIRVAEGRN
ncbi:exonuclease SbcCD subunit D [Nocardiopsis ansamitocini]|uniref:Nuclease SbcCD subunit D n=1 Tax=Nocardiopsis ansamitocini TaxID=1670832 RepID=A0A9W6P2Y6_9ACTN|nr:exonuclease SbcCD subunit D [Nocardiopsis ansamitocini]GLU46168.1 nuclease SbcCD subunit D [Nocardiopsis ansamitocini]